MKPLTKEEIFQKVRRIEDRIFFADRCVRVMVCPFCGGNLLPVPDSSKLECQMCRGDYSKWAANSE